MASLIQVRDAVALQGKVNASQLSHQLASPRPLVEAMLDRLVDMGKVTRIEQDDNACLNDGCKSCSETKKCITVEYELK